MNYFAHLHIASITQTSWAGNLLGDFAVDVQSLDADLWEGWNLHQQVDVMVDKHPASLQYRQMPRKGRRRFAGIVQDIVMDYWLIQYWSRFSSTDLEVFCERAVQELAADQARCPKRLQSMIDSLLLNNWLGNLGTLQGVENALHSIMRRWKHGAHLQDFVDELPAVIEQGEAPFLALYPDLLAFVAQTQDNKLTAK
ncbi:acyl carrier protein phosphodiesterase [Marinomonas dokdonensis]|uniref:acyl carrier protein phosphodiesterase n=1 Tax=Marinomonas dokdonensis TaxID=328224 RepID=UPI0040554B1C